MSSHVLESPKDRDACAAQLAHCLTQARSLRLSAANEPVRASRRQRVREFQAARLADTHADLLADPQFSNAARFFLTDLYSPRDLSARDAEIARVLPIMTGVLPLSGLQALLLAAEVDALSERFDGAMIDVLGNRLDAPLSRADYAEAYRQVGDRAGRTHQIDLIRATGDLLSTLAHKPGLGTLLKTMRRPAQLAGLGELQAFLERGFDAFRSMRRADEFLNRVIDRERALAAALFAGDAALAPSD